MSTPAIYGLKKNGIIKSSYCHAEGWLNSLGKNILSEFKNYGENYFSSLYDRIIIVDSEEKPTKKEIENSGMVLPNTNNDVTWYELFREYQGTFVPLFKLLNSSSQIYMPYASIDSQNLSYLLDLDRKEFVYYKNKKVFNKVSFDIIEIFPVNEIIKLLECEKEEKEKEFRNISTNIGKTKEEIILELLLSLNQGDVGYLTKNGDYTPRIDVAIGQYNALVNLGIIIETK